MEQAQVTMITTVEYGTVDSVRRGQTTQYAAELMSNGEIVVWGRTGLRRATWREAQTYRQGTYS